MRIRLWCSSDRGLVRENNEDAALVDDRLVRDDSLEAEFEAGGVLPLLVADGMGGHAHGEIASEFALREFRSGLGSFRASEEITRASLEKLIREIHLRLLAMGPEMGNLGTTLCGLVFVGGKKIFHVNVGDSRLYRFRDRFLRQLSVDHSLRQETGNPSVPGNWLTSVVGGGSEKIKICVKDVTRMLRTGDTLLICSDGLSEYVDPDDILMAMRPAVEHPANELVAAGLAFGGFDNITAIVLKLD